MNIIVSTPHHIHIPYPSFALCFSINTCTATVNSFWKQRANDNLPLKNILCTSCSNVISNAYANKYRRNFMFTFTLRTVVQVIHHIHRKHTHTPIQIQTLVRQEQGTRNILFLYCVFYDREPSEIEKKKREL